MILLSVLLACATPPCAALQPGERADCGLSDHPGRDYTIHVPASWDGAASLPVIVAFHGGGGDREGAIRVTCPEGARDGGACLSDVANQHGYVVVTPDGSSSRLKKSLRTWNAGGGGAWQCVSGRACEDNVDDVAYVNTLLDDVARVVPVDPGQVYATGLSNGGAMSHRLGCELADRFVAIAAVGGANQFATTQTCSPVQPVSVLQIHGTEDNCWQYDGGTGACLQKDELPKVGARASTEAWAERLGCVSEPSEETLLDLQNDGTTTEVERWSGCQDGAVVELLTVRGGGHTWPQGWPYLERLAGRVSQDWSANEVIVAFFGEHRR